MCVCLCAGSTDLVPAMATDKAQERTEIKDCKIIFDFDERSESESPKT